MSVHLHVETQIDRVCLEFEDQLRKEASPSIENFLDRVDAESRKRLFTELLLLAMDYGEPNQADLIRRFPGYEDTIHLAFAESQVIALPEYQTGQFVGRYKIQEKIGQGTFGRVYRAKDSTLGRTVAIKSPLLATTARDSGADRVERFLQEAVSLASLKHPNIVAIHDVLRDEQGYPCLILEHVDGAQPLDVQSPRAKVLKQLICVADALDIVHQNGFLHRDIKPSNVLIDSEGRVVLTDFGLSARFEHYGGGARESVGTPRYMSPELVRGHSHLVDARTDIWSVGVILYQVLAGNLPFDGEDAADIASAILQNPVRPFRQGESNVDRNLEEICLKCLRKAPEDRYATARDLAADLRKHVSPHVERLSRRQLLQVGVPVAGGLALCAVAFSGLLSGTRSKKTSGGEHSLRDNRTNEGAPSKQAENELWPAAEQTRLTADLTIHVTREGSELKLEKAIPLRAKDKLAFTIETSAPATLWLYLVEPDGELSPLLSKGQSNKTARDNSSQESTSETGEPSRYFCTDASQGTLRDTVNGTASFILFGQASDGEEQQSPIAITDAIRDWKPQRRRIERLLRFHHGEMDESTKRGFEYAKAGLDSAILNNQLRFQESRFHGLAICLTLCVPFMEEK